MYGENRIGKSSDRMVNRWQNSSYNGQIIIFIELTDKF